MSGSDRVYALFCQLVDLDAQLRTDRLLEVGARAPALAREVEELLVAADRSPLLLRDVDCLFATSGEAASGEAASGPAADPLVGCEISHYRITERLGGGGMGVVYRARDARLGRTVALKLLPPRAGRGGERVRLIHEARAASALDHPNIATIHDILQAPDGRDCIVMAHYEGRTLKELLGDGPLDPDRIRGIGMQVARGLEAAHARGIVHCDVKPANIMVTSDGVAKILDFGLARFTERWLPGHEPLLGTLPYMAPEQIEGIGVTPRTDVWALGVTLCEMATGRRPFEAEDPARLARAILHEPARPASMLRPGLPAWLDGIIARSLRREPAERPPEAGVVRRALEAGPARRQVTAGTGRATADAAATRPHRASTTWIVRASAALVLALAGVLVERVVLRPPISPRFGQPRQISSAEGVEDFPAWSPQADAVVYQGTPGGEIFGGTPDVMLQRLDADVPRNLTTGRRGFDGHPSWSPDGSRIAFFSDRDGGGLFIRSLNDGSVRCIWRPAAASVAHNAAAWSPDGTALAVTADGGADPRALLVLSAGDGALLRRLPLPGRPGNMLFGTVWSPDGRFVALADAMNVTPDESKLWVVRMEDGAAFPVTAGSDLAWSPAWGPDGRSLYFVSDRSGSRDLWVQSIGRDGKPRGGAQELTAGVGMRNIALSRDGSRLVYSKGRLVAHVWRIPTREDRVAGWKDAEQITTDRAYVEFVDADPRGRFVLVSSDRSGHQALWRFDLDRDGGAKRLTSDPAPAWAPMLSPDGRHLAYYAARSGNRDVWVRSLDDGTEVQLTHDPGIDFVPSWAPEGERLVFASGRSGNLDIWAMSIRGGSPRQLTKDPARDGWPQWSPDGTTIVFRSYRDGQSRLWSVPAEGGEPQRVSALPVSYFRWSRDGSALYLISRRQLWVHHMDTGEERQLTNLTGTRGGLGVVALALDEHYLYFTWEEDIADLWMMERVN